MKVRLVHALVWLPLGAAALWLAYVMAANWALDSSALREAINRSPDRFYMEWQSATSVLPGSVRLEGVSFVGQGTRSVYYGRIDLARFRVALLPLLRKTIRVGEFKGEGVDFRLRQPTPLVGPAPPELRFHPPIPGLDKLPRRTAPRRPPPAPSWRINVQTVYLRDIEEVWIHGTRLIGPGRLLASLDMQVGGPFRVRSDGLNLPAATLIVSGETAATNLETRVTGEMGPLVFSEDDLGGMRAFDHFWTEVFVKGDLQTIGLLRRQFGRNDYVDFGGGGTIDALIRLDRGVIAPESELRIDAPRLQVVLGEFVLEGAASVIDVVEAGETGATAGLKIELEDMAVRHRGRLIGSAPGRSLEIESESRALRAEEWFEDATFRLRVGPVILPEGSWVNAYIPEGLDAEVTSGRLTASAGFQASGSGGEGLLSLDGDRLGLRVHDLMYESDLRLRARFQTDDLNGARYSVAGSSLLLTNIHVPGVSRAREKGWHGLIDLEEGHVTVNSNKWVIDGHVEVDLRDTRPILGALSAQEGAPNWLWLVPTLHNLRGTAELTVAPPVARIRNVNMEASATEIRAELLAGTNGLRGIAYVRYGIVSAGFDLRDEDRKWRMFGAKRWYERALSSPLEPPPARGRASDRDE